MIFSNYKVVELASVLAGPMVGSFFAEWGADVVKIENKVTGGDVTRNWKLSNEDPDSPISAYYASANYGKKVMMLNLNNNEDYQIAISQIKRADIVIVNFKSGDSEKLKLDYQTLKKINPKLIYGEITGFGKHSKRAAFDVVLQAEAGFMSINGEKDAKPLKMPVAMIDILAAHHLKEGILCALLQRKNSEKGCKVSVSLYEAAVSSLANQATNWLMNQTVPQAIGSIHPNIAPYGDMSQTQDSKWIVFAIGSDRQFQNLCKAIGQETLAKDIRFSNNQQRVVNREQLMLIINQNIVKQSAKYWEQMFNKLQIPFGVVRNIKEVFENKGNKDLVLEEKIDGVNTLRAKTSIFHIIE